MEEDAHTSIAVYPIWFDNRGHLREEELYATGDTKSGDSLARFAHFYNACHFHTMATCLTILVPGQMPSFN